MNQQIVLHINLWRKSTCCQPPVWTMYTPGEEVCFMPPSVAASTSASGQCVPKSAPTAAPLQSGYLGNQAVLPPQGNLVASLASKSVPTSQTIMCQNNRSYINTYLHQFTSYKLHIYEIFIWILNTYFVSLCFCMCFCSTKCLSENTIVLEIDGQMSAVVDSSAQYVQLARMSVDVLV